jgi:endo-1,4-beta-xylanase
MQGVRKGGGGKPILCWDVVNEAIGWDKETKTNGLKSALPWYPTIPNYVDLAFQYAREADPEALLFYNDYSVVGNQSREDAIYKMAKSMIDRNIPIDGIGLQYHVKSIETGPTRGQSKATIARFGSLGLQVHITEIDVECEQCGSDQAAMDKQAKIYEDALGGCFDNPKVCTAFVSWGFTDKEANKPFALPFDVEMNPKPAFTAMLNLLNTSSSGFSLSTPSMVAVSLFNILI